ncbi:hypothetical protein AAHA92_06834 [Salvia divinorum]|uniref:Ubiquitin-like protease family profile domain-containing protein n=1 Tax=Salvia divinorum TaxID=28513 RepID=A0ABD1I9Y5_SALDI
MTFLVCFYVDIYVHCRRRLKRSFPMVKGWMNELLKSRQDDEEKEQGFGMGNLDKRINKEEIPKNEEARIEKEREKAATSRVNGDESLKAMDELMDAGVRMASAITLFVEKLNVVPQNIREMKYFKIATSARRNLMGLSQEQPTENAKVVTNLTQAMHDDDIDNPHWIEAVEAMMIAFEKKSEIDRKEDIPSFSLNVDFGDTNGTNLADPQDEVDSVTADHGINKNGVQHTVVMETIVSVPRKEIEIGCPSHVEPLLPNNTNDKEPDNDPPKHGDGKGKGGQSSRMYQPIWTEKKTSLALRSPFNERAMKVNARLNQSEKELIYWVLSTKEKQKQILDALVYQDKLAKATKSDFASLGPCEKVAAGVINAWCSYLNNNKKLKSPDSTSRLFLTTYLSIGTVFSGKSEWEEEKLWDLFQTRVMEEVRAVPNFNWSDYDLVRKKFMVALLMRYERQKQAVIIKKAELHVVPKSWRTKVQGPDCGVYLMRYMETYFGIKDKDWDCGLTIRSSKALEMLRVKFCKVMLAADVNIRSSLNITAAKDHWKISNKNGKINFDDFLASYGL